jgi:hypothetical protein
LDDDDLKTLTKLSSRLAHNSFQLSSHFSDARPWRTSF